MREYMFVPCFLVMMGVVASLLVLPSPEDLSVMRASDAKRFQVPVTLAVVSAEY